MVGGVRPLAVVEQGEHRLALRLVVLHRQHSAGTQQPGGGGRSRPGSTPSRRARQRPPSPDRAATSAPTRSRGRDVGRIAHHHVDRLVELSEQKRVADVARHDLDLRCRPHCGAATRAPRATRSTAMTRADGTSCASATASAPEPEQRSTTTDRGRARAALSTASTSSSVSGRGMNTPGPTAIIANRNGASPVRYCSGSRAARRRDQIGRTEHADSCVDRHRHRASAVRSTPSTWAEQQLGIDARRTDAGRRQRRRGIGEQGPN